MNTESEELLEYYKRELNYLRKMGREFSESYPKIAARLDLGEEQSSDPHMERLLESFAFLTARIQYQMEGEFPKVSASLLECLSPQLVAQVPSMTVARFHVDPDQGQFSGGYDIPRETELIAVTHFGRKCRFRTCYPTRLLPYQVSDAGIESIAQFDFLDSRPDVSRVLRIRLEKISEVVDEDKIRSFRFYLSGDRMVAYALYELLFGNVISVALYSKETGEVRYLGRDCIRSVGFGEDEKVLPYPSHVHPGYRILHEYCTFPEKFLFFDLEDVDLSGFGESPDFIFCLDHNADIRFGVDRSCFALGCTPVINLFRKTSDPIRLDEKRVEYRIYPDKRREDTTEIHSILSVSPGIDPGDGSLDIRPYFSFAHDRGDRRQAYWISRREPSVKKYISGTNMFLSLKDLGLGEMLPDIKTVFAQTLCTNRHLADEIPAGALLQHERDIPVSAITVMGKPTTQIDPPVTGETLWKLVSHLTLNHLSLEGGDNSLAALKEILTLYSYGNQNNVKRQIFGILELSGRKTARRLGKESWRGFVRGTHLTVTFDEAQFVGGSAMLLGEVLSHFFAMYASINSFTRLSIRSKQREGIWKQWQPRSGDRSVL